MKRLLYCAFITICFTSTVLADTVDDVLPKFGVTVDSTSSSEAYKQLLSAYNQFKDTESRKKQQDSLINFNTEAAKLRQTKIENLDVDALYVEMNDSLDYLTSLVQVDAELSKIFEAEKAYKQAKLEYETCVNVLIQNNKNAEFDIHSIIQDKVSNEEYSSKKDALDSATAQVSEFVKKPDIGKVNNLRYPVVGSSIGLKYGRQKVDDKIITNYGLDFQFSGTQNVQAVLGGKVVAADYSETLGNYVIVAQSKELVMLYSNLDKLTVQRGVVVKQYQNLGTATNSMHLGTFINNVRVDPTLLYT